MTQVVIFLFEWIKKIYEFGSSFKFEFFGYQVSVFSLLAGFSILFLILKFLQLFVPTENTGLSNIGRGRNENRMDKRQESRELKALRSGGRHVSYSSPRHTNKYKGNMQTSTRSVLLKESFRQKSSPALPKRSSE